MTSLEVEETIRRITSNKGVEGVIICNNAGVALKSTLAPVQTARYAGLLLRLVASARSMVRSVDAENDLVFLRMRTLTNEIMVAPDKDFVLVVIQSALLEETG